MSTFHGKIKEIPGVSVDRFDKENLNSTAFFLSHCHTDHMTGLATRSFQEKLIRENRYLYLSSISAIILRALVPQIVNQIKVLPLEQITSISMGNKDIAVTCIPAGHCPGSVMFLFETNAVCVLYTGDYRIHTSDFKKFKCFYDTFGNVKPIDTIYLDTTFFLESYFSLPKREDSLSELCKIILSWTSQDPKNCVKLDVRAKYGYEYVYKKIYDCCKMPVHVDTTKYNFYSIIPELDKCVTTDGSTTQIHNCHFAQKETCDFCNSENLRIIKLSAFRWENDNFERGISEVNEDGIFFVCYSTHASYEEGIALIDFLRPKNIHICVERPDDVIANKKIKSLVENQLIKINGESKHKVCPKLFEVPAEKRSCDIVIEPPPRKKVLITDNILDSPPRDS